MRILPLLLALLMVTAIQLISGAPAVHFLDQASTVTAYAATASPSSQPSTPAGTASGAPQSGCEVADARRLFDMLNQARVQAGVPPLEWDDRLAQAAQQHTEIMAQRGELSHDFPGEPPLRARLAGFNLRLDRAGENVAYDPSVEGVHEGWLHSPPHRENMLNPKYNAGGIAVVARDGMFYATTDFAHRLPEMSDAQVPGIIGDSFARLRRSAGVPVLPQVDDGRLRELACRMGRTGSLDTNSALTLPGARYAVAYTATEPDKLPSDVVRLKGVRDVNRYGLGVCFANSTKYPNGVYWVVMVLFSPQRGYSVAQRE